MMAILVGLGVLAGVVVVIASIWFTSDTWHDEFTWKYDPLWFVLMLLARLISFSLLGVAVLLVAWLIGSFFTSPSPVEGTHP